MTFEEWLDEESKKEPTAREITFGKSAWNAATAAERKRCREIAKQDAAHSCRQGLHADAWKSALRIADEIGDD